MLQLERDRQQQTFHNVTQWDKNIAALIELFEENPPNVFEEVERRLLRAAYRYCDRNQVHTARLLGISRNVVRARLIQYGELQGSIRPLPLSSASATATRSIRHEA